MDKTFFEKTKVKIALAYAVGMLVITFAESLMTQNGMTIPEGALEWVYGGVTTIMLSLLGAHTVTDTTTSIAKIRMAQEVAAKNPPAASTPPSE